LAGRLKNVSNYELFISPAQPSTDTGLWACQLQVRPRNDNFVSAITVALFMLNFDGRSFEHVLHHRETVKCTELDGRVECLQADDKIMHACDPGSICVTQWVSVHTPTRARRPVADRARHTAQRAARNRLHACHTTTANGVLKSAAAIRRDMCAHGPHRLLLRQHDDNTARGSGYAKCIMLLLLHNRMQPQSSGLGQPIMALEVSGAGRFGHMP